MSNSTSETWPGWYPGKPLKAQDLLGLEDFLLARSRLSLDYTGVFSFDYRTGLTSSCEGDWLITVQNVSGFTEAGQPVEISHSGLQFRVPLDYDPSIDLDLSVVVNPKPLREVKLALLATKAEGSIAESLSDDTLDLGRYRWLSHDRPLLVRRPWVVTLLSIRPFDNELRSWLLPWKNELKILMSELEVNLASTEHAAYRRAALVRAAELSVSWPYLPIPQLVTEVQILRELRSAPRESNEEETIQGIIVRLKKEGGDALPQALSSLLRSETSFLPALGDELSSYDLEAHFEGNDWICTLRRPFPSGILTLCVDHSPPHDRMTIEIMSDAHYPPRQRRGTVDAFRLDRPEGLRKADWIAFRNVTIDDNPKLWYIVTD